MNSQPKIIPIVSYDNVKDTASIIWVVPEKIESISINGTSANSSVTYEKSGLSDTLMALEKPAVINYKIAAYESTATGLLLAGAGYVSATTSAAGTTQADGTALTKDLNLMTTVGSGTGVVLPSITTLRTVIVYNNGANALKIYGYKSSSSPDKYDYIGTTVGSTGVTLAVGAVAIFYAKSTAVTDSSGKGWQQLV